jgi:hypothetical protein
VDDADPDPDPTFHFDDDPGPDTTPRLTHLENQPFLTFIHNGVSLLCFISHVCWRRNFQSFGQYIEISG